MEPEVRSVQKRKFLLETIIFRVHVKFRGSNLLFHDFSGWIICQMFSSPRPSFKLPERSRSSRFGEPLFLVWTWEATPRIGSVFFFFDLGVLFLTRSSVSCFCWAFSYDRCFDTKQRLFFEFTVVDFFGKDWRIGWLVGGWEFEVGIPGELQLIISLLKKHFYFLP